jgi:hypothetical protein
LFLHQKTLFHLEQRREAAKHIPACVQNDSQRVRAPVALPVKVSRAETVAAYAPQKHKPLPAELVEQPRKGRDDLRVQPGSARLRWRTARLLLLLVLLLRAFT